MVFNVIKCVSNDFLLPTFYFRGRFRCLNQDQGLLATNPNDAFDGKGVYIVEACLFIVSVLENILLILVEFSFPCQKRIQTSKQMYETRKKIHKLLVSGTYERDIII